MQTIDAPKPAAILGRLRWKGISKPKRRAHAKKAAAARWAKTSDKSPNPKPKT